MRLGWRTVRLKRLARNSIERTRGDLDELPFVGLDAIEPWTGRLLLDESDNTEEPQGNRFQPQDVLFGKLRPYLAKVATPNFHGQCTGEALVLRPEAEVCSGFLRYRLVERGFIELVNSSTFGAKMPRASWGFIGNIAVGIPDLPTQKAIAAFLDRETARIDQLIEKKQRLVELLGERNNATFEAALAQYAASEHLPLHRFCKVITGKTPSRADPNNFDLAGIRWATPANLGHWKPITETKERLSVAGAMDQPIVDAGTVLVNGIGASLGKVGRAGTQLTFNQQIHAIVQKSRVFTDLFLFLLLRSMREQMVSLSSNTTIPILNGERFGRMSVPMVDRDAQIAIQTSVMRDHELCENARNVALTSMGRLKEYRSALITAAVTGQIDVETWSRPGEGDRCLDQIEEEMAG